MNILEELWYGDICPISREYYRAADYRGLVQLMSASMAEEA